MKNLKAYGLFLAVIAVDLAILVYDRGLGARIIANTSRNFLQMAGVIPPIFLLLGLLDVWVPRETVVGLLGEKSGIKGVLLSVFLGAAAAGPLYGAFPVAGVMIKKGARLSNILIFLGAWSTLKIPMFLFEMSSLGYKFAVTRWAVDVFGIIIMAHLIERLLTREEKEEIYRRHAADF
ncbi:permease [Thermosediminibacter litoriperuensis]|uniref:Putative permease n=1 Tax=Thermosediminibacter litoriperuensis TaxID=291989 RepID=A0A5S5B148_9FIRM|nr:permease [Thermosediminibacter litoriperuensis]TYP58833.1 putative permease [Thermosediminibacter litoriperuensis]